MSCNNTVLVISNGRDQFTLAAYLLREDGYCVLFENDISRGLQIAIAEPPHLIVSELAVPNVDGLELCCRVRLDKKLKSTPILLVGDLSKQSSIVTDALRCGATAYIQKPFDQFKLFDLCRRMAGLGGGPFESPDVTSPARTDAAGQTFSAQNTDARP